MTSDLRFQCTTPGRYFPELDTVSFVIFGLGTEQGEALALQKESLGNWTHKLSIEL